MIKSFEQSCLVGFCDVWTLLKTKEQFKYIQELVSKAQHIFLEGELKDPEMISFPCLFKLNLNENESVVWAESDFVIITEARELVEIFDNMKQEEIKNRKNEMVW